MKDSSSRGALENAPLGKFSLNPEKYNPELLFPISRSVNRALLNLPNHTLPFVGVDIWNAYEISWLSTKGKPEIAIAQILVPADSKFIIESKSLKLYLNSLNNHRFVSQAEVKDTMTNDLSKATGSHISIQLSSPDEWLKLKFEGFGGKNLDRLDIEIDPNDIPNPYWLNSDSSHAPVEESLFSNLLKSNCPVTGQPDWASIQINYVGAAIAEEGLLRYLISFRNHQEFHEHCVEKIFCDIKKHCQPIKLSVYARYTRRGGLDINPYRADFNAPWPSNFRQARQ
ncbi:MAG: NADPH-dependent 7-cyano-7-deazaguanine reductase QueF [Betaproteobacteria bacterium]